MPFPWVGTSTGPGEFMVFSIMTMFNTIWETGEFPESWRLATKNPIPKPG